MLRYVLIVIYYLFLYNLPDSKFCRPCTYIRTFIVYLIIGVSNRGAAKVERRVYFGAFNRTTIGSGCQINENCFIQGANIGSNVLIAPNVSILSQSHNYKSKSKLIIDQGNSEHRVVHIGDDVWIGRNVVVAPGAIILNGAVVGANSFVRSKLEKYGVYGGTPAKKIGERS